ncbi:MAG: GbsR/MarR family transcriptional regulator [Cyclobacteriaceae bacterium]
MPLNKQQQELVEKIGVFLDKRGLQPALGRILGLLMVIPKAEASFEEIQEHLSLSKSAVSYGINLLQSQNKIDYITRPGERKRFFVISRNRWPTELKKELVSYLEFGEIVAEVLSVRGEENTEFNNHLEDVEKFMRFLKDEIPPIIDKYIQQHPELK